MKELERDLQSVAKSLKALTEKTEKIAKKLDKLAKPKVAKKPKRKPKAKPKAKLRKRPVAKKTARLTASETVLSIIKKSRKGVDNATLRKETAFEGRKIRDILYRLKKQRKIKSPRTGFYVKA